MRGLMYRVFLTVVNIFFPPLAVMILCGPGYDCMLNCCFFLLAVIPSHIHGFYLTCTYFHRRSKAKKGRWPGGPKTMIASSYVLNGGVSDGEAKRLYRNEFGLERKSSRRSSSRDSVRSAGSKRVEMVQTYGGGGDLSRTPTRSSRGSNMRRRDQPRYDAHAARDGYGPVQQLHANASYYTPGPTYGRR